MSNLEKANNGEYSFLENRTIHELEELLHIALRDTSADEAYLAALEAAILRRETGRPTGRLSDTDKAWDKFRCMYLAGDADKFALSDEVEIPETVIPLKKRRQPPASRRPRRTLLIAAVVVLIITLLLPSALGHRDIFQMVAQWSDEQFKFVPPAYGSPRAADVSRHHYAVTSLIDSLQEHDLPLSFAPTWLPEDRHLKEVSFREDEQGKKDYTAVFTDENYGREIFYDLTEYPPNRGSQSSTAVWEKDDGEVIEFICNGITHYIMTNNKLVTAVWYIDPFEVGIGGNISIDEAKAIIESIYERTESGNLDDVTSLRESLQEHDLPLSFAPKWFPEDRHLAEIKFDKTDFGNTFFTATFVDENEDCLFRFKLIKYSLPDYSNSSIWEKDAGDAIEFICGGVTHYIISNSGLIGVHWYKEPYEAAVSGHITLEEAKAIIQSIYEG